MNPFDDMPVGTCLRNRPTGTTYVKTHRTLRPWLVIAKGRADRFVTSTALDAFRDLVPLVPDTAREGKP